MNIRRICTHTTTIQAPRQFRRLGTLRLPSLAGLMLTATAALIAPNLSGLHATSANSSTNTQRPQMMTMTEGAMQMQMIAPYGNAPTWSQVSTVYTELSAAKQATAKYQDIKVAINDGYMTAPILLVADQGYHYLNVQYLQEWRAGHYNLNHPPFLVYNSVHGKMVLSGLMYLVAKDTTPQQLATIFPSSMAGWHRHINNCVKGTGLAGTLLPYHTQDSCTAHGGTFNAAGTGWMTHAWIWNAGGTGLFDMDMQPHTALSGTSGMGAMPGM